MNFETTFDLVIFCCFSFSLFIAFIWNCCNFIAYNNSLLFIPKNQNKQTFLVEKIENSNCCYIYIKRVFLFKSFYSPYYKENHKQDIGGPSGYDKCVFSNQSEAFQKIKEIKTLILNKNQRIDQKINTIKI